MLRSDQHIILIGFKHVGKSSLGKRLTEKLERPLIDLDDAIENLYQTQEGERLSCYEIVRQAGEDFFRALEQAALADVLKSDPAVIALGGGACLNLHNQTQLHPHFVIHVTATPVIVFDRIMQAGIPAFFPPNSDPKPHFKQLWQARDPIYQKLATISVANNDSLDDAVEKALAHLKFHF